MSGAPWKGPDRVANGPVRDAFLASRLSATEVCHALGWYRKGSARHTDVTLLCRVLGLKPSCNRDSSGRVRHYAYVTISVENAKLICGALGVEFDSLYEELPASRALGGVCGCGERMLRPAPRCGFCELEQGLGLSSGGRVAA